MAEPTWLPSKVLLEDSGSDWDTYLKVLYLLFQKDYVESLPSLEGEPLQLKRDPMRDGKEATFWHLVTEGSVEENRTPDEPRCQNPMAEKCDRTYPMR